AEQRERRAHGRARPRAGLHPAKAGTRRAWPRWDGATCARSGRTTAGQVAPRSSAFRKRVSAARATAAAGAGDKWEIRANSLAQSRFCEARAKVQSFQPRLAAPNRNEGGIDTDYGIARRLVTTPIFLRQFVRSE